MRIAVIVLSLFSVSFAMAYFSVLKRLEVLTKAFAQLVVLNSTIQEAFEANIQSPVSKEDQDIHKENFIKFLSDSRDWAFEYIEDTLKFIEPILADMDQGGNLPYDVYYQSKLKHQQHRFSYLLVIYTFL